MQRSKYYSRSGVVAFSLLLLSGCDGAGPALHDVSGKVTFSGKPLPYGTLEFIPNSGNPGPAGSAEVVDGQYDTSHSGGGVVWGMHKVRISGYEEQPTTAPDETVPAMNKPPLFAGFAIEVNLSSATQDFDIPESARGYDMFKSRSTARASGGRR